MQSNRVHYLRKGYSWPKLGNHSRIGCFLKNGVQAEAMENQANTEITGKPAIKVKPEVPPKPMDLAKLEVKLMNKPAVIFQPEIIPKVEIKIVPGARFESVPLGKNKPEVNLQTKREVIEVSRQIEEMVFPKTASAAGAIPKIMLKFQATLRVKRQAKDNAIPKEESIPHQEAIPEVKGQTGDANNLKQELLSKPKVITELIMPSPEVVVSKADNKPKAGISVNLSQTDKADLPMPENKPEAEPNQEMIPETQVEPMVITLSKPEVKLQSKEVVISKSVSKSNLKAEPNQDMIFKTHVIPMNIPLSKPEVNLHSKVDVISKSVSKSNLETEPNQETDIPKSEEGYKSEAELNQEILFKPQVTPEVRMHSEGLNISKPVSKSTIQDENTPETDIPKSEKSPKSKAEFNQEVIFKPQVIPEVIMHSEGSVISKSVSKSNQEAEPSQETVIPKSEKSEFNQELLLKPHFRPYAIFLRKSELIVHSPPKQEAEPNPEMVHMLQTKGKSGGDVLEPQDKIKPEVNHLGAGDKGKSADELLESVKDWLEECKNRKPEVFEDFDFFADGDREKSIEEMEEDLRKYKAISERNYQRRTAMIDREFGEIRHNIAIMSQAQDKMNQQFDQWLDLHTRQVLSRK